LSWLAAPGRTAPGGDPAKVPTLGSWRLHDPERPRPGREPWTPEDVVDLLAQHPDRILDLGIRTGLPAGNASWIGTGKRVDEAQAIAASRGLDLAGRLCVPFRLDVMTRLAPAVALCSPEEQGRGCDWEGDMDGSLGERETVAKRRGHASGGQPDSLEHDGARWAKGRFVHRLLVLRPGTETEEARRIVSHESRRARVEPPWTRPPQPGDTYEVRGSFDPAFARRVPRAEHESSVRRFWAERRNVCGVTRLSSCAKPAEPLDPLDARNERAWPAWVDRSAVEALASSDEVPALYGSVQDEGLHDGRWEDPYFSPSYVVMDLANPEYRHWRIRYLLYKLGDFGLDPGEGACVIAAYKPGFHVFHDEARLGPPSGLCALPGNHTWTGPSHVCVGGRALGGPLLPTPFAPGEYEAALNAFLQEMITTLTHAGYANLRVITTEKPAYRKTWSILSQPVRAHPKIVGEWAARPLDPPLPQRPKTGDASAGDHSGR
jgi:hypothetical protein